MDRYKENNCRICKKVFCCKKCREQHETRIHKIFVDCNICLYGKTFLQRDPPECLINHIKYQHWPLHCIFCKQIFESLEELLKQSVCQVDYKNQNFKKSPYTPIQSQDENKCYLPKEQQISSNPTMFSNLATSTPLQREEPNLPEKSQEAITPVEFLDINRDKNYYTDCVSMKRKVTFCETPVAEKKEDILEIENMFEGQIIVTPSSAANNSAVFYSAKQYPQENLTCHGDKNEISIYTDSKDIKFEEKREINNAEIGHEESVLWISAVNTSPDFIEGSKPFIDTNNFPTPSIAKLKKRQVNVVMPTAIRNQNVELELPSNMSLTTLNTSISEESTSEMQQDSFKPHLILKETSVNKVEYSSTDDTNGILAKTSTNSASLWTSMSKIVKTVANVVQEFSSSTSNSKTPLKRIMEDDIFDGPHVKRYKLTEIKCRPPIRHLAIEYMGECKENLKYESSSFINRINKTFVDKATQTDEWFPQNC